MKQKLLFVLLAVLCSVQVSAQTYHTLRAYNSSTGEKGIYFPTEWYNSNQSTSGEYNGNGIYYSMSRKVESANFVVFWDQNYGSTAPNQLSTSDFYYVDLDNLLAKAEEYYALYATTMGFVNPTTSTTMSKYKCMICIMHSEEWAAYGGGYDFVVPALWINPATCKPVGHTIAHEIGHSFHYMAFAESNNHQDSYTDNTGFHLPCGNGQAIWEQTAQFQAASAEPDPMFPESYPLFGNNANYAFSHEWMRYQSYWFLFYLNQYYNDPATVGKVWNQPMKNQSNDGSATDFCQAYIKLKGLTAAQFYERYFDYALRCATFDFDVAANYRDNYIGKFDYHAVQLASNKYQVAYQSAPQSTGFNVIELNATAGSTLTTKFTALQHGCALADGDPGYYNNGVANANVSAGVTNYNSAGTASYRGFRVGYVFLKNDGTRVYYNDNTVHCTGTTVKTENISTTVPTGTSRTFLVVAPALTTYVRHPWDENILNDDQWPYQFELEGATAKSVSPIIKEPDFTKAIDGRSIADVTLTYNVVMAPSSGYDGTNLTINGSGLNALCTAFQMEGDNIFNNAVTYSSSQSNGTIMEYGVNSNGNLASVTKSTNGDFGHWFNDSGTPLSAFGGVACAEWTKSTKNVFICQMPNANSAGITRTIREALVYKNASGKTARATFIFNISFQAGVTPYAYLSEIDYTKPAAEPVSAIVFNTALSKCIKIQEENLTVEQGSTVEYALTPTNISTLGGSNALNFTGSDFESNYLKSSTYFKDAYLKPSDSNVSAGDYIHFYAISTAPNTTKGTFKFYPIASATEDSDFSSNTYTHYYLSSNEVINAEYANEAMFKVAYDRANAKFIVKAADNCPPGTYNSVRFAMLKKTTGTAKYYVGYFTFNITVTEPATAEETLNVERYPALGYGTTEATVDLTAAKTFLGVEEVTTDMLRIVNPDGTLISDYATYDGWFNADGVATAWGENTKICVKFFQAISSGTYTICDMNGADVIGNTYTVKWALVNGEKTYTYNINVTFVEKPAAEITLANLTQKDTQEINFTSALGQNYEAFTSDVDIASILTTLGVSTLNDLTIYAVQSDGSLDDNYKLGGTDGWRNAGGDWQAWGNDAFFGVKADFALSATQIYFVGGMEGKNTDTPATYTATYAFVKNGSATHDAVILKVNLIYPEPTPEDITLPDTETSYTVKAGDKHNVTLQRSLPAGKWLTFCAPFNIYNNEFEGMGISKAMQLGSVTKNGNSITLNFVDADAIMVGIPVIIQMSETKTGITKTETGYGPYDTKPTTQVESGTVTAQMIGTYVKIDLPNDVYYLQDDKFRHTNYTGDTKTTMKGWRAYFTVTDTGSEVKQLGFRLDDENVVPTDIEGMEVVLNDRVDVYTVAGTKVKSHVQRLNATEGLPAGIYLVGGKKVIVK